MLLPKTKYKSEKSCLRQCDCFCCSNNDLLLHVTHSNFFFHGKNALEGIDVALQSGDFTLLQKYRTSLLSSLLECLKVAW